MKTSALKTITALAICLFALEPWAKAGVGIFGTGATRAVLNVNGGGNVDYDCNYTSANPDFQGANLGTVSALILNGGTVNTFKNGSGNVYGAYLAYRVWSGSASGSYAETSLPFDINLGGGDQRWQATGANINLLSGLTSGTYTLELYFRTDNTDGGSHFNLYDSRGSLNYQATFTVVPVPEPVGMALPAFGAIALSVFVIRYRRTKVAGQTY